MNLLILHVGKIRHAFMSSAEFFNKKNSFRNVLQFGSRYAQHFVMPNLGPNCLHRFSADDTAV